MHIISLKKGFGKMADTISKNGALLCETYHREAEKGIVIIEDLCSIIGIMKKIVPP